MRAVRRLRFVVVVTAVLLATLLPASSVRAVTITVTTTADEYDTTGTGAGCSLREAIRAASDDSPFGGCPGGSGADVILLAGGVYTIADVPAASEDNNISGDFDIRTDTTIRGAGASATVIDGPGDDRVFEVLGGGLGPRLTLERVMLGGGSQTYGGGILVRLGTLSVVDSVLTGHTATIQGGGIAALGATVTVTRSLIVGGAAGEGGGIYADKYPMLTDFAYSSVTVTDSTVGTNTASTNGGGIQVELGSTLTLANSTVNGNVATTGDGIWNRGTMAITNSTISGNGSLASGGLGGGIYNLGTLALENATVSGNTASFNAGDGGNIYNSGAISARNTITHEANSSGNCGGPNLITSNGYNLDYAANSFQPCFGEGGGNVLGLNPLLGPLQDNGSPTSTHALGAGSPAVDKGIGVVGLVADQRGAPRPFGAAPDIGAYERSFCGSALVNIVGTAGNDTLTGTAGSDGILGLAGNDALRGVAASDGLCGGAGNDVLDGSIGNDHLDGGLGNDTIVPGTGTDRVIGGSNVDTVSYAASATAVSVDLRLATGFATGQGRDTISAVENVVGTRFADVIRGSGAANWLRLGGGSDQGFGFGGADRIDGGTGSDRLFGGTGNDALFGEAGNDSFDGGSGRDRCRQGPGTGRRISCELR